MKDPSRKFIVLALCLISTGFSQGSLNDSTLFDFWPGAFFKNEKNHSIS